MTLHEIGIVKSLQIQRSSLKIGQGPEQVYDPAALLRVEQLKLSPQGVIGRTESGDALVYVHNALHPESRNGGDNGISISFTSHYEAMRARFGPHMTDGVAGENILVEASQPFTLDTLGECLLIEHAAAGKMIRLEQLLEAAPCEPFSRFALDQSPPVAPDTMKATLQFLNAGMRGFYASAERGTIQTGDRVFVSDS